MIGDLLDGTGCRRPPSNSRLQLPCRSGSARAFTAPPGSRSGWRGDDGPPGRARHHGGFGLGLYLWAAAPAGHTPHLYFESAAIVIAFVLLGKWLEERATRQTVAALSSLERLAPATARVVRNGVEAEISVKELAKGERILVRSGERLPADGVIVEGTARVDEALVTGESAPVDKAPAGKVIAGSLNLDGRLVVDVTARGAETTLARIVRMVESAQASKPAVQRLADRVSAMFVPVVVVIALVTLAGWLVAGAGLRNGGRERGRGARHRLPVRARPCDADRGHGRDWRRGAARYFGPRRRDAGTGWRRDRGRVR